ncbi:MAG: hypothetical protein WC248_04135 [Candidatus Methanomethylophilaceae archaeon]|jgi:hypothetical protein
MIAQNHGQRLVLLNEDELDLIRADLVDGTRNPIKDQDPGLVDFFKKREALREKLIPEIETLLLDMSEENCRKKEFDEQQYKRFLEDL